MALLEIKNIFKSFKDKKVLSGINLNIEKGKLSSIFGYSGEGKSTLLSIICGITKQDRGDILLKGENINKLEPYERSIALVMDEPLLFPNMNISKNIAFGLKIKRNLRRINNDTGEKKDVAKNVKEVMEILGITGLEKRYPNEISMGQAQRVSLARALATKPEVLLMDEPFSNLDIISKTKVRNLIKSVQSELSITTLLVTHDIEDVMNLSDTMFVINNGKIQESGDPKDILKKPKAMDTAYLLGTENIFEGRIDIINEESNTIIISIHDKNGKFIEADYQGGFEINENVFFVIRPEDIIILKEDKPSSKAVRENHFTGRITRVVFTSRMVELLIVSKEGTEFKVFLPYHAYEIMNLNEGKTVFLSLKKSAIHIIKRKKAKN